jgi:hypothetical protein
VKEQRNAGIGLIEFKKKRDENLLSVSKSYHISGARMAIVGKRLSACYSLSTVYPHEALHVTTQYPVKIP